jgi:hypothetical protein
MVRVTGQLDAPLVDMGVMQQEYWERQEVTLPSLAKLHKPKGWRRFFYKAQTPKIVLKRIPTEDWERINNEHYNVKKELAKDMPAVRKITKKIEEFKELTNKEQAFMIDMDERTKPILYSMLAHMIIEPKMDYEDVILMFEFLDDFDSKTLLAIVNTMTAERASVANAVARERTAELTEMRQEMRSPS